MTGFGDASKSENGASFAVEVRSVNNKYLKCNIRIPDVLASLEPELEQIIRSTVSRGSVTLTVTCSNNDAAAAQKVNAAALRSYAEQISEAMGISVADVSAAQLVHLPGVLQEVCDEGDRLGHARKMLKPLVKLALEHMVAMRTREGVALRDDLAGHLDLIEDRLGQIAGSASAVVTAYSDRLQSRMELMLSKIDIKADPSDVIREVAVYAEKTDIAEEIARLGEHLVHFNDLLNSADDRPIGRTMDFLSQELLREANTIASKSPDAAMSRLTVEIKGAIDRIKEQVQNAE
ncbi:MAG: YicC family protein [Phycisphaerales bacterium]|nr:YicC family protein [Phycisphaerales bacterium]